MKLLIDYTFLDTNVQNNYDTMHKLLYNQKNPRINEMKKCESEFGNNLIENSGNLVEIGAEMIKSWMEQGHNVSNEEIAQKSDDVIIISRKYDILRLNMHGLQTLRSYQYWTDRLNKEMSAKPAFVSGSTLMNQTIFEQYYQIMIQYSDCDVWLQILQDETRINDMFNCKELQSILENERKLLDLNNSVDWRAHEKVVWYEQKNDKNPEMTRNCQRLCEIFFRQYK